MTVRMGSCQSLIEDNYHVNKLHNLYASLDAACTPLSIIAPWIPIWGGQERTRIIRQMSELIRKFVVERRKAEVLGEDAIDMLVLDGLDDVGIINVSAWCHLFAETAHFHTLGMCQFVMRLIFAGIVNTGMNGKHHPIFSRHLALIYPV